jgi:hypothetical protein
MFAVPYVAPRVRAMGQYPTWSVAGTGEEVPPQLKVPGPNVLRAGRTDSWCWTLDLSDLSFQGDDICRTGRGADAGPGPGFIEEVNGLVRKVPARQITVRKTNRRLDSGVGEVGLVMVSVAKTCCVRGVKLYNGPSLIVGRSRWQASS